MFHFSNTKKLWWYYFEYFRLFASQINLFIHSYKNGVALICRSWHPCCWVSWQDFIQLYSIRDQIFVRLRDDFKWYVSDGCGCFKIVSAVYCLQLRIRSRRSNKKNFWTRIACNSVQIHSSYILEIEIVLLLYQK